MINVSWSDAQAFITWLNQISGLRYRLPSEAEWEYAARAGTATNYPWGKQFDASKANGSGKSDADQWSNTAPVGSFPANAFGLYDMVGNVWEWTQDCSNYSYEGAPADGSAWVSGTYSSRMVRGGSWSSNPVGLRVSYRSGYFATLHNNDLGFRLAQDL